MRMTMTRRKAVIKEAFYDEYERLYNEVVAPQEDVMDIPSCEGDSTKTEDKPF